MLLLFTSGAGVKVGKRGRAGWQGSPWGPSLPCPGRLTHLQLIEVICAVFPRQTLHNAWHWGVAQTGTYGTESLWLTLQKPCLLWHHVAFLQFTATEQLPPSPSPLPPVSWWRVLRLPQQWSTCACA